MLFYEKGKEWSQGVMRDITLKGAWETVRKLLGQLQN